MAATEQIRRPRRAVRAPAVTVSTETPADESGRAFSGEIVDTRVSRLEWVLYSAFVVVGAIMRMWQLGARAMHHDESLHATYSWYLWENITGANPGSQYSYDPMMHGPYQFHGNALMYLLFGGPSEAAARLNAAICGTALIALPFLLRRQLGRTSSLILSALLAFSPAYLYYSRFTREDIYFALWTMLFFVGLIRWLDARGQPAGRRWLYVAAAGFALSWSTKESTFFVTTPIVLGFLVIIFGVGLVDRYLAPRRPRGKRAPSSEESLQAAIGAFTRTNLPPLAAAFRGTPLRAWAIGVAIMAAIIVVLYWPVGAPLAWGFIPFAHAIPVTLTYPTVHTTTYSTDAFLGGIQYWLQQQHESRGNQPWYYYFLVIPLYEQVSVVFGAGGIAYFLLHRRTRLALYAGASFLVFTLLTLFTGGAPALQLLMGLLMIVSGLVLLVSRPRTLLINLALWWTVATWGLYIYAGEKMPWLTIHMLLPLMVVAAAYLGHLFHVAPRLSRKWLITTGLLAITALISFRSSVALSYVDGANPTEMLVYTQTSQDVPNVSQVIHRIPLLPTTTGADERVWIDGADTWPWVWYLHDDPSNHGMVGTDNGTGITTAGQADVQAAQQRYPVVIVGSEAHDQYLVGKNNLAQFSGYTGYKFKLRAWFPEDGYRSWEQTGIGGFLGQAVQPSSWGNLVNWWATRTPFEPSVFASWGNVYPFYVYVRNDLVKPYITADVGHAWDSAHNLEQLADKGASMQTLTQNDVPASLTVPVHAALTIDVSTLAQPIGTLRDVAVDTAGNIYVADAGKQRIVKFDRAGHYLTAWGSAGTGPGQFNNSYAGIDPAGLAIGPGGNVYVSDWNRIEEFTPQGALVRAFGAGNPASGATASSLYGPRQINVAPNGNIYVADTGNKRIQVYGSRGTHLFNIGTGSTAPAQMSATGSFDEPSGVAVDTHGVVYVADYWNKRVQRFSLDGAFLSSYPINGWASSDYGEPYLAVDNHGHLFATDAPATNNAHINHVLELNATTGVVTRAFGTALGASGALTQPTGIAVGPDGALYIADTGAGHLLKLIPQ